MTFTMFVPVFFIFIVFGEYTRLYSHLYYRTFSKKIQVSVWRFVGRFTFFFIALLPSPTTLRGILDLIMRDLFKKGRHFPGRTVRPFHTTKIL